MAKYRNQLPQLSNTFFITNGGLETTLIYHEGVSLPHYASFDAFKDGTRYEWMKNYLSKFANIARKYNVGFVLENETWRANPDWIRKLGYSDQDMVDINRRSIETLCEIRHKYETNQAPMVINASIGPRSDAYNPTMVMSPEEAQEYHAKQIGILSETNADMVTGLTMTYPEEAIGIARAAKAVGMPVVISFTVEMNGKLASGQSIKEAIELVDESTQKTPVYYMINCAHPTHFQHVLNSEEPWTERIRGVKGNASKKSHAELDQSKKLDDGDPAEFGEYNRALLAKLKNLNVFGGCCGTDCRHVEEICKSCIDPFNQRQHSAHDAV